MPSSCTGYCLRNHLSLKTLILVKMQGLAKESYLEHLSTPYRAEGLVTDIELRDRDSLCSACVDPQQCDLAKVMYPLWAARSSFIKVRGQST